MSIGDRVRFSYDGMSAIGTIHGLFGERHRYYSIHIERKLPESSTYRGHSDSSGNDPDGNSTSYWNVDIDCPTLTIMERDNPQIELF